MRPGIRLTVLFAMFGYACFPPGWTGPDVYTPTPGAFPGGPYLISTGNNAVAIAVESANEPTIRWALEGHSEDAKTAKVRQHDRLWVANIDKLPADQALRYTVSAQDSETSHPFRAGRAKTSHFRFAAFGDTRGGHAVHQAIVRAVAKEHIDFVINTGDLVSSGDDTSDWDRFFAIERPLIASHPLLAAIGNHDTSTDNHFRRRFANKLWNNDRRYYARDWGRLRVVIADTMGDFQPGSEQYVFIENALSSAAKAQMYIMLVTHHPPYSAGAHRSELSVRQALSPLASRYGVELFVSGHDHNYERTKKIDGVTYIVTGSAGAPSRRVRKRDFTLTIRTQPHYVLFDVETTGIAIRAINLNGETFDYDMIKPVEAQP